MEEFLVILMTLFNKCVARLAIDAMKGTGGGQLMNNFNWSNRSLEKHFNLFQELAKHGWRIELERIDQIDNGTWWKDEVTGLPIPNQRINGWGDTPLVTWSTYVYPPNSDEWVMELNASFDSPMEAYEWLAPRLEKYVNEN